MPRNSPQIEARPRRVSVELARPFGSSRWPIVGPAFVSALLLWLAYPPCDWWPLAWVAPLGWLRLISRPTLKDASRPYLKLFGVGLIHWLLMIQWIRLPHWSAWLGWWALALYLAVYLPLFIAMTRALVHQSGLSIVWAAPITWTGLEFVRSHLLTGFSMSLLGHTQLPLLPLIQVADLTGAYGVSFLVMMGAAALERLWTQEGRPSPAWGRLALAPILLAGCWTYGEFRLRQTPPESAERALKVALIQGVFDTEFDGDLERPVQAFRDYVRLSQQAVAQTPDLSLLIWPESMFTADGPMITYDEPLELVPEWNGSLPEFRQRVDAIATAVRAKARWVAQLVDAPLIVGTAWDHFHAGETRRYNSAVHIDREGNLETRYDKMHPVMFGEYIPGGEWFPWLYRLTPMPAGLTPGTDPVTFEIDGVRICPSICFENTVPHLIRRQVRQLKAGSKPPDLLVTITNDGWFWGSSLLDVHLACGIFRAVETRLPLLIAANTGFSAWIDANGRVRAQGPRRKEGIVVAEIIPADRSSLYLIAGDWFAGLCLIVSSLSWVKGWRR